MSLGGETVSKDTFTNRQSSDDFAGVGIHHRHHLVVATGEKTAALDVHREPAGFLTRRERPSRFHLQGLRIKRREFAFIFDIHEYFTGAGTHAEFRLAVERDIADDFSGGG